MGRKKLISTLDEIPDTNRPVLTLCLRYERDNSATKLYQIGKYDNFSGWDLQDDPDVDEVCYWTELPKFPKDMMK